MSSFLSEIRKGSTNKTSRVVNQISKEIQKLKAQNVVIEDEGLIDNGKTVKGRVVIDGTKLIYSRQISTTIPTHKVPVEPDREFLTFWTKANHTGLNLIDSSRFDNIITVNNNRHLCLGDSGGLDLGYLGKKNGVNSVPAWILNGINESAQVDDDTRLQIKSTVTGFSITAWIKPASFTTHNSIERRIVAKTDDANNAYALFVTPTNKAAVAFKHADGTQFKVETPASLVANTWYFIAATFKSSATKEAKIYLNGTVSTTAYSPTVTYPDSASFPSTKLQLFGNGIAQLQDPVLTDLPLSQTRGDTGDFHGQIRDVRIWREKILSQTEITQFNTNRVSISNLALGESHIAGFVWSSGDIGLSSFTSQSFSSQSFNL